MSVGKDVPFSDLMFSYSKHKDQRPVNEVILRVRILVFRTCSCVHDTNMKSLKLMIATSWEKNKVE